MGVLLLCCVSYLAASKTNIPSNIADFDSGEFKERIKTIQEERIEDVSRLVSVCAEDLSNKTLALNDCIIEADVDERKKEMKTTLEGQKDLLEKISSSLGLEKSLAANIQKELESVRQEVERNQENIETQKSKIVGLRKKIEKSSDLLWQTKCFIERIQHYCVN